MPEQIEKAIDLLKRLIATPSFSKEEEKTAEIIEDFFRSASIPYLRQDNNVWAKNKFFDEKKPTILLNSHHDTVGPNPGYKRDPFSPQIEEGKLFGLGSNDAGASLVSLLTTFAFFYRQENLNYNLIMAASAEEEISGKKGIESILPKLGPLSFALVGEPTEMDAAIAEKGLMVLDGVSYGEAGHAAREEGMNAIYLALSDIQWFQNYRFEKVSPFLGKTKMSLTMIQAGSQHNVVPAECHFVIDVRVTEAYQHEEVLQIIRENISSQVTPRSTRLKPSRIDQEHPVVLAAEKQGAKAFGSATLSDQALLSCPSLKMGPGKSERSHSADEFIYLKEIENAIPRYIAILQEML